MHNPHVGDLVTVHFKTRASRPAIVEARGSVINSVAYAAFVRYQDGGKPRTQSVTAEQMDKR